MYHYVFMPKIKKIDKNKWIKKRCNCAKLYFYGMCLKYFREVAFVL